MDMTQVRTKPGRSKRGPDLWFINKTSLKQRITHPEWGLWNNHSLSKEPQTPLSTPVEHRNTLIQETYRLKFVDSFWHTFGICKYCAVVTLEEIWCYEVW